MATSVPKSYQATINHGGGSVHFPGNVTHTDIIFQVPAGKTWLVIKMMWRVPAPTEEVASYFRIDKASSDGTEQIVLLNNIVADEYHKALGVNEEVLN